MNTPIDHADPFAAFDDSFESASSTNSASPISTKDCHIANGGDNLRVCPNCRGRGYRTYGYNNPKSFECRMCRGQGRATDARIRASQASTKAAVTARDSLSAKISAFNRDNPEIVAFLAANAEWSDFYRSMQEAINTYGSLTERQMASVRSGMAKMVERKAARVISAPSVDVSRIEGLFDTAMASNLKKPVFRATLDQQTLSISRAPEHGKNAGSLYVKVGDLYAGKISGSRFHATRDCPPAVLPRLLAIAEDPAREAVSYGRITGNCGCCGRELTDPISVARGIGPICADNWGL
jgi:hypothetical protein